MKGLYPEKGQKAKGEKAKKPEGRSQEGVVWIPD